MFVVVARRPNLASAHHTHRTRCLIAAALLCLPSPALTQAFNFDDVTPSQAGFTSLVQTKGAQMLTLTPVGGGYLFAANPMVPLLGPVSIYTNTHGFPVTGVFLPMLFAFASPVSFITFAFGDAGVDDDDPARIEAFDSDNNSLGVFEDPYPAGKADGGTRALLFEGAGASYFIVSSGTTAKQNTNSLFWEVAASTMVTPEPPSIVLVGAGLLILAFARVITGHSGSSLFELRLHDNRNPGQGEPGTAEGDRVWLKIGNTVIVPNQTLDQGNIQLHLTCRGPGDAE